MPIRFKCTGCGTTLSIALRKAGQVAVCPKCCVNVPAPAAHSLANNLPAKEDDAIPVVSLSRENAGTPVGIESPPVAMPIAVCRNCRRHVAYSKEAKHVFCIWCGSSVDPTADAVGLWRQSQVDEERKPSVGTRRTAIGVGSVVAVVIVVLSVYLATRGKSKSSNSFATNEGKQEDTRIDRQAADVKPVGRHPDKRDKPEPPVKDLPVPGTFLNDDTAGYETRRIDGFVVMLSTQAIREAKKDKGRPFQAIDSEFKQIVKVVPEESLSKIRDVIIWIEWNNFDPKYPNSVARYCRGEVWPNSTYEGMKNNAVELLSLKKLTTIKNRGVAQIVMLHELAHVYEHKVVGFDDKQVVFAYKQAMERHLYDSVKHDDGREKEAYAAKNHNEYFAELTCMYFDRCLYYPFERKELKEYDAAGYRLMERTWGRITTPMP